MNARLRRIISDYEQIKKDFANHKNITVEPVGTEPYERFQVTYYVNGVYLLPNGQIQPLGKHVVNITLHSEYPRYKPICTITTPIWHPNFKDGQICIGDIWGAGESLSDIIVNIGDMIQYKSWNSFSPLSADAAKWAIENKHLFPVGNVSLWVEEEATGEPKADFDIDLFSDEEETEPLENSFQGATLPDLPALPDLPFETVAADADSPENDVEYTETDLQEALEDDFTITAEELAGVEFTPSAARMHGGQYGGPQVAKGGKVNFKTIFTKGILYGLIGSVAGWLLMELTHGIEMESYLRLMGYSFSDLYSMNESAAFRLYGSIMRISSGVSFSVVGMTLAALLGVGEGFYYGSRRNALKFGGIGLGVGLLLGFLGGYMGQFLYSALLSDTSMYPSMAYLSFVRAIGWSLMGAGIGLASGLIKPSKIRLLNCVIGGCAGGFFGGFAFNFVCDIFITSEDDTGVAARFVGILLMGALIGLGIGLLEQFAKPAWLKVIRGEFEGKEYLVFEGVTSIGNSGKNTIVLFKDKLVAPFHCEIVQRGSSYEIVDKGSPTGTIVNGMRVQRHTLRPGDAISLGNSVLIFNTK